MTNKDIISYLQENLRNINLDDQAANSILLKKLRLYLQKNSNLQGLDAGKIVIAAYGSLSIKIITESTSSRDEIIKQYVTSMLRKLGY